MAFQIINDGTSSGGGGGGTVNTANGIVGTGASATPVKLGGSLNANTVIGLAAHLFKLNGNHTQFIASDEFDLESAQFEYGNAGGDQGGLSLGHGFTLQQLFYTPDGTNYQRIYFNDTANSQAMAVQDDVNSIGFQNAADYSADTTPTRLAQFNELGTGFPHVVASIKVVGVGASETLITYLVPNTTDFTYRISFVVTFRTGAGSASMAIGWTDETNTVNNGTLVSRVAAGTSAAPPIVIEAQLNTDIVINANITGTAIADFYAYIEILG
jgi:hypothetical protein